MGGHPAPTGATAVSDNVVFPKQFIELVDKFLQDCDTDDDLDSADLAMVMAENGLRVITDDLPVVSITHSKKVPAPQNPQSWFCPHCGNDRPQYTVLINNPVQMIGVGIIQTATLVCLGKLPGKDSEGGDLLCRRVLSAQVVNLQLDNALLADPRHKSPLAI
jgi:hypothetical protein